MTPIFRVGLRMLSQGPCLITQYAFVIKQHQQLPGVSLQYTIDRLARMALQHPSTNRHANLFALLGARVRSHEELLDEVKKMPFFIDPQELAAEVKKVSLNRK